jgi:putative PIN family toxin of toxin-antitoxin system
VLPAIVLQDVDAALRLPRIRRYLREPREAGLWLADIAAVADLVGDADLEIDPVTRDPDDDIVLAAARAGRADVIATGDDDLLVLGEHAGIPVVPPRRLLALLR